MKGDRPHLRAVRAAAPTCSTAIIEVSQGFKKREAQRPVIVAITTEGPGVEQPRSYDQVLEPLRDAARRFTSIVARAAVEQHRATRRATATSVLDEGPRDDRRPARRRCSPASALAGRAEAARRRADAPVPRHLRAAAVADPAGARHRRRRQARADGARHADQREARTGPAVTRSARCAAVGRRRSRRVAALAARSSPRAQAAAAAAGAAQPAAARRPFRAGVDLVSLNVTVTDGDGALRHRPRRRRTSASSRTASSRT